MRNWHSLLLIVPALLYAQPDDAQKIFERAVSLHQSGDFEGAIQQYTAYLKADPTKIEARSNLGAALAHVGRYSEAIEQYRIALAAAPPQMAPPLRMNLALAYYKTGEIPRAAQELSAVHSLDGRNLQVTLLLADCQLRMGDFSKVIELLRPLDLSESRESTAIRYMLGTALIRNGQVREGQSVVDPLLRDANSAEARFLVGMQMFTSGDFPSAVQKFRGAIEAKASLPSLQSYYGQALLFTGDADGAVDAFHKALAADANDFDANFRLGQILEERRQYSAALPLLEQAVRSRPGSLEVHEDLAKVYAGLKRPTDAARETAIAGPRKETAAAVSGPAIGQMAPEFSLPQVGGGTAVQLKELRRTKPVLLVFGSYTCPQLRSSAPPLQELYSRFSAKVEFLFVYIHEAHAGANWQSTINQREGIQLNEATTEAEKREHAALCIRKVKFGFPAAVDGLDNHVETLYAAWPSRAYLIGRDGKVLWSSALGELEFKPGELETAIRGTLR
jgi:tetratricopeptide (TPR) repeat protein